MHLSLENMMHTDIAAFYMDRFKCTAPYRCLQMHNDTDPSFLFIILW